MSAVQARARLRGSRDAAAPGAPSARRSLAGLPQAVLSALSVEASAMAVAYTLVDALTSACGARRVSIAHARARGKPFELMAMSGQAQLDRRRHLSRRIEGRLEQLRERGDPGEDEQRELADDGLILVHTSADGTGIGVLIERAADRPFTRSEAEVVQGVLREPIRLMHRLQQVRTPRWRDGLMRAGQGSRRRIGTAIALIVAALMVAMPIPSVVKARAAIEPRERQVVSAPEAGHLQSAHAREGDRVLRGQLLARLDDRAARRALDGWQAAAARNAEELARALAMRDRAALGELRAEATRLQVEIDVAERSIERTRLLAPFDGVVLSGDPGRRLGAPVDSGEALFEIAAIDDYRLMLDIDERDVRLVHSGQSAQVRMAGLPDRVWDAALQPLLPVAVAEPGRNAFRMPAALRGELGELRPGMKGVARIRTGDTVPLAALTRSLRERLLLLAWRFGLVT